MGLGGLSAGVLLGDPRVHARGHRAAGGAVRIQPGSRGRPGGLVPRLRRAEARRPGDRGARAAPSPGRGLLGRLLLCPVIRGYPGATATASISTSWSGYPSTVTPSRVLGASCSPKAAL